jgi:hypothetical protein
MKCRCGANLAHLSARGEPMMRTRGIVLKAEGLTAICPKCKGDVPVSGDMAKALSNLLILVFKGR